VAEAAPKLTRLGIGYSSAGGAEMKLLDSGGALMVPFEATFTGDQIRVTMTIDVAHGWPICSRYQVERTDGGGLELMTTEIMRGLNLRRLMANACARVAMAHTEDGSGAYTTASTVEAIEAVVGPIQRRRRMPATDEGLKRFADEYLHRFEPGRMREFAEGLGYSERQGWRLLALARTRGILPPRGKAD